MCYILLYLIDGSPMPTTKVVQPGNVGEWAGTDIAINPDDMKHQTKEANALYS